ncbi:MAG TPA: HAD family phosphatase [Tepidisphaeraceae bacterium]|jgi:HAD superfamily hydrolase (TIGR01509 family)
MANGREAPEPLRAIIFDMDGLMVDTEPLYWEVARKLARSHGTNVAEETLRRMMGRSRLDSMRIYATECGITSVSPQDLLAERERLMLERYSTGVELMPGLREILERFHGRLKLAVATSSPKKFTDVLVPALRIAKYFDVIQTGDEILKGKPDPEIYLRAMARLEVQPHSCIVLEDSRAGALAGHNAGAYVIAVPSTLTAEEDFSFADDRAANLIEACDQIERTLRNTAC